MFVMPTKSTHGLEGLLNNTVRSMEELMSPVLEADGNPPPLETLFVPSGLTNQRSKRTGISCLP
jgi:hypothetical protein